MVALLFAVAACRHREEADRQRSATSPSASSPTAQATPARPQAPRPPPPDATNRLPEDPVKARLASEQWDRHLEAEERERRQRFDRAHEREHEAVLAAIERAKKRYLAAKTAVAIRAAQSAFHASLSKLEQAVLSIDPGHQSSELAHSYAELFRLLDGPYPDALVASVVGDPAPAQELEAKLEGLVKAAHAWLEAGEDEHDEPRHN